MKYKFDAYINGIFTSKDERLEIVSPLTNEVVGSVPALKTDDINAAFIAARSAFKIWRNVSLKERETIIKNFTKLLDERKDELAQIMHDEIGKDVDESRVEIIRTVEYIDKTIVAWKDLKLTTVKIGKKTSYQHRVPLGVVLAISPFNYPVNLSLAKIIPALLAGNTVVFKAATNGSLTGAFLAKLFDEAHVPVGAFNYVTGKGRDIGDILTSNKEIDMVTFTGGVAVGKHIAKQLTMKPLVLELGGNDAAYVRKDADLERAIKEIVDGAFGYSGQRCTAIKRVILHESIANKVIEGVLERTAKVKTVPLITLAAAKYVKELYDDSVQRGDKTLIGGHFDGNRIDATIVLTTPKSRAWKEEAFGPLLPIAVVSSDEEAIAIMNDTEFGLQNSIFTEDREWAKEVSLQIESGSVNINAKSSRGPDEFPFLGMKDSGFGVQGIDNALLSMTRILNIVDNE